MSMVMKSVSVEMQLVYGDAASDGHAICVHGASGAVCVLGVQPVSMVLELSGPVCVYSDVPVAFVLYLDYSSSDVIYVCCLYLW